MALNQEIEEVEALIASCFRKHPDALGPVGRHVLSRIQAVLPAQTR
jgi:hypothetical protein